MWLLIVQSVCNGEVGFFLFTWKFRTIEFFIFIFFFLTATGVRESSGLGMRCPPHYWDIPSVSCSAPLYVVLEKIQGTRQGLTPESMDLICGQWDDTYGCYQQLLRHCSATVPGAFDELNAHINRLVIYSTPCRVPHVQYGLRLVECFLPFISKIQTCTEAFDKEFKISVLHKQYKSACRVVTVTIKCYHDIKTRMQLTCRQSQPPPSSASPSPTSQSSAADEYHNHYIRPLVEQTRAMVLANCSLHPSYIQYYNQSPAAHSFRLEPLTLSSIVALLSLVF